MKLEEIKNILKAEILLGENLDLEIENACGAELISDILSDNKKNAVLLTGLTHNQIVKTAFMSDFKAIIFVRGKMPGREVIDLAREYGLILLRTLYPLYESCGLLFEAGLKGDIKNKYEFKEAEEKDLARAMELSYDVLGGDFNTAGRATEQAKKIFRQIGIDPSILRRVSIAAYEAEMNIVIHAYKGKITFNLTPKFIEIIAEDEGPGIPDIDLAMQEGYSTAPAYIREMGFGAGMGLPNMKKFSDKFEITSVVGKGTKVRMIIYLQNYG
ncbi:ATP-binding protein [Thermovenabulum gondwanense]|uniref:Serine/threonine-protein kinase RsbT n=1 Tax=Thermovenabulum gondwanense TaxID=520767 RepID=A0A161PTG1_9FIRM|nr:anti-sigma regulatory factor [Thermovenabulum gondwanense]KYO64803.1 Serine/threonine-protein kinase RsbT [Thermovenabulum gondwanense]